MQTLRIVYWSERPRTANSLATHVVEDNIADAQAPHLPSHLRITDIAAVQKDKSSLCHAPRIAQESVLNSLQTFSPSAPTFQLAK